MLGKNKTKQKLSLSVNIEQIFETDIMADAYEYTRKLLSADQADKLVAKEKELLLYKINEHNQLTTELCC